MKKRNNIIFIVYCLLMVVVIPIYSYRAFFLNLDFDFDEFEHIYSSLQVSHGLVPYRDFFQHHHPLLWFIFAPAMWIFYNSIAIFYIVRFAMFLCLTGTAFYLYKISRLFSLSPKLSFLSSCLYLSFPIVMSCGVEFRPDNPMVLCLIAGLYYFLTDCVLFQSLDREALKDSYTLINNAFYVRNDVLKRRKK